MPRFGMYSAVRKGLATQPLLDKHQASSTSLQFDEEQLDPSVVYFYEGHLYPIAHADSTVRQDGKAFRSTSFGMPVTHPLRSLCVRIVCDPLLDALVLSVIALNCFVMLVEPSVPAHGHRTTDIPAIEWGSMGIFTLELLLKMLAHGLAFHTGAFLHDPWNLLDLAVVLPFWALLLLPNAPSLASLRLVRALRPLRTIRSFPDLRKNVVAFIQAGPALGTVAGLTCFFFLVFGVTGVEMFEGSFHMRCTGDDALAEGLDSIRAGTPAGDEAARGMLTSARRRLRAGGGGGVGERISMTYCTANSTAAEQQQDVCASFQPGSQCAYFADNPPGIVTHGNLDSIREAGVVLLQAMTFNDWHVPMYELMRARPDYDGWVLSYFNLVTIVSGFFIFNIFVAVIFDEVIRSHEYIRMMELAEADAKRRSVRLAMRNAAATDGAVARPSELPAPAKLPSPLSSSPPALEGEALLVALQDELARSGHRVNDVIRQMDLDRSGTIDKEEFYQAAVEMGFDVKRAAMDELFDSLDNDGSGELEYAELASMLRKRADASTDCCGFDDCLKPFGYITSAVILLNVAVLCAPYQGAPEAFLARLDSLSLLCTTYFVGELALKVVIYGGCNCCEGWRQFWSARDDHQWNRLDFFVLALDVIGLGIQYGLAKLQGNGGGIKEDVNTASLRALRVFRALRILRAFKLARSWQSLNNTLRTLVKAAMPVASLAVLILLFTLMFALLGKELFGGKGLAAASRFHFDQPLPALLTVMTIFTGEWTSFYYEALAASMESVAILSFVVLTLLIGHFVVVNLFVAVLVNAFVADERERWELNRARPDAALTHDNALDDEENDGAQELEDVTCGCLGTSSPLRVACHVILAHELWTGLVVLLVLASCICLAFDDPRLDPTSPLAERLRLANLTLIVMFSIEAALKIIATGLASYLKSGWNLLDMLVLLTSMISLLPIGGSWASMARLLRVIRPLALIGRVPGMQVIFRFFSDSTGDMLNVIGLYCFFQLVFAVIGIQLFAEVSFEDPTLSFNDIFKAMLLLFVTATGDAWEDLMWTVMDAPAAPGDAPVRNDSSPAALFFVVWIYIGQFVMINMFVATVVNSFMRIKEIDEQGGSTTGALLTTEQRQWQLAMIAAQEHERTQPESVPELPKGAGSVRAWLHRTVTSNSFGAFMTAVVLFNVLVMASRYHGMEGDPLMHEMYVDLMWLCTRIYYLECLMKLGGLSVSGYFRDEWNRFDFSLVVLSLLDEFATEVISAILPLPPMLLRVLRVARVLRAVRMFRSFKGLRTVVTTLLLSFPSFLNVGFLLSLVTFVYAVLGVHLFAFVGEGVMLHGPRSFQSVGSACELLLQCLTGDGWSSLMLDCANPPEFGQCDPNRDPTDCGSPVAFVYFISYTIIGMLVLTNCIVAVILQNFSMLGDINPSLASKADIEAFSEAWHRIDIESQGFIASESFPELLLSLERPLRPLGIVGGEISPLSIIKTRKYVEKLVARGYLPPDLTQGFIEYQSVLLALITFSFQHYNRAHLSDPIQPSPVVQELLEPTKLVGWDKVRQRSRASILKAEGVKVDTGQLVQVLAEEGTLGRGTTAEQLRSLTELIRLQTLKIDKLEEESRSMHEWREDMELLLPTGQRKALKERTDQRNLQREKGSAAKTIAKVVVELHKRRTLEESDASFRRSTSPNGLSFRRRSSVVGAEGADVPRAASPMASPSSSFEKQQQQQQQQQRIGQAGRREEQGRPHETASSSGAAPAAPSVLQLASSRPLIAAAPIVEENGAAESSCSLVPAANEADEGIQASKGCALGEASSTERRRPSSESPTPRGLRCPIGGHQAEKGAHDKGHRSPMTSARKADPPSKGGPAERPKPRKGGCTANGGGGGGQISEESPLRWLSPDEKQAVLARGQPTAPEQLHAKPQSSMNGSSGRNGNGRPKPKPRRSADSVGGRSSMILPFAEGTRV